MHVKSYLDQREKGELNLDIPFKVWKGWDQSLMTLELD